MRLTTRQTGIISYAGLDKDALWAKAKRIFAQAEEEVPERYAAFLPIFPVELVQNMSYVGMREGNRACVSPAGFSIDPVEYHQKLYDEMPELYQDDNYRRNFDYEGRYHGRGVMTVDRTWATYFPQYQPFLGERLMIHMIGGGHQAVAVPESVYPRGCGVLRGAELELRITARCEHVTSYIKSRLAAGEKYHPAAFEEDYLRQNDLLPVCIRQSELGRVMQDLSIMKNLQGEQSGVSLFTENAKRAENITQYVPFRCACDTFESAPITRATARLIQLCFSGDDYVSDLWLPYQDASEYIDRQRMTLDVRALCEGFQIAPVYDPATGGGRYPDRVRVVIVRDREIRLMVTDTLNNPAYGSGMSPLGMINKLVFLAESGELLRQHKLALEEARLECESLTASRQEYRAMMANAVLQEHKGKLIDAMYRRESALSQMQVGTRAYERAKQLLDERVNAIAALVERKDGASHGRGQLSGYDADIDYLRRKQLQREGIPEDEPSKRMPFAEDAQRELSIEGGYAMRNSVRCFGLAELYEEREEAPGEVLIPEAALEATGKRATDSVQADGGREKEAPASDADASPASPTPVAKRGEPPESKPVLDDAAPQDPGPVEKSVPPQADGPGVERAALSAAGERGAGVKKAAGPKPEHTDEAEEPAPDASVQAPHFEQLDMFAAASAQEKPEARRPAVSMARLSKGEQGSRPSARTANKPGKMAQLVKRNQRRS